MAHHKKQSNRRLLNYGGLASSLLFAITFVCSLNASANPVYIQATDSGRFFRAPNGGGDFVYTDRDEIWEFEKWTEINVGGGKVAYQCANGMYMRAVGGGWSWLSTGRAKCDSTSIGSHEKWTKINLGNGEYALQCANGRYLNTKSNDDLQCFDPDIDSNNKFRIGAANPHHGRVQPFDPGWSDMKLGVDPGYDALLQGDFMKCGMPKKAFDRSVDLDILQRLLPVVGMELTNIFLKNPDYPRPTGTGSCGNDINNTWACSTVGEGADAVDVVNFTCLSCHGSKVPGTDQYKLGLPATQLDYGMFFQPILMDLLRVLLLPGETAERAELDKFQDTVAAFSDYMTTSTLGGNPAINIGSLIWAFRDGLNADNYGAWQYDNVVPELLPMMADVPFDDKDRMYYVDAPAWWVTFKGNPEMRVYHNGESKYAPALGFATLLCGDDYSLHRDLKEDGFDQTITDIMDYIATISSPKIEDYYPNANPSGSDIAAGKTIYNNECSSCHGTYDDNDESLDNYTLDYFNVGTDPRVWEMQASSEFGVPYQWKPNSIFWDLIYSDSTVTPWSHDPSEWQGNNHPADLFQTDYAEYKAPYLRGVWTTAPYLHNGSIPDLATLLEVDYDRSVYWRRFGKSADLFQVIGYDVSHGNAGWEYWDETSSILLGQRVLPQADALASNRKYIYDTTIDGHSNSGHNYGTSLSASDKVKLIEYLKSL